MDDGPALDGTEESWKSVVGALSIDDRVEGMLLHEGKTLAPGTDLPLIKAWCACIAGASGTS